MAVKSEVKTSADKSAKPETVAAVSTDAAKRPDAVEAEAPAKTSVPASPKATEPARPVATPPLSGKTAGKTAKPVGAPVPAKRGRKRAIPRATPKPITAPKPQVLKAAPLPVKVAGRPAPLIQKGKTSMTDTITKVQETARKFAADVEERTSAALGDVTARARTAFEKGSKSLEGVVEFQKGNLEALVASGRVAAKGVEEIAKYSAEYGRTSIEKANANAKKLAAVKSPTELFQLQGEIARTALDEVVAEGSKFSENYLKLLGDIFQPLSNRYAVAAEQVKKFAA